MNKILVTGGEGFLGRYVVDELLKRENLVVSILIKEEEGERFFSGRVNYLVGDLRDEKFILENVKDFDRVYHIAGNIRTSDSDFSELHYDINVRGTLNLLKACRKNNVGKFIFISTCEVYGDLKKGNILEEEERKPVNDYAKSKLSAEKYCEEFSDFFKIIVVRPSYIYGYGQHSERLFPRLIESSLRDKKITLSPSSGGYDFVYVKDVARGIVLVGEKEEEKRFNCFNLSSGKFSSIKEIFDIVSELTKKDYDREDNCEGNYEEREGFYLNIDKIKECGFLPKYDLRDGISDFMKSYKKII